MKTVSCYEADVAIVGGGIAGCTLAMALAPSYKVILLDKLQEPAERVGESLAPAARRILRQLDLLKSMEPEVPGAELYLPGLGTQSYWGSEALHIVDHLRNPDGLGWHLDRRAFEKHIRKETVTRGIQCLWGVKLYNSRYEHSRWWLKARSATATADSGAFDIAAKFVIDASGRPSGFAKQSGISKTHFDNLVAHWAILPGSGERRMSTISAAETGWWYSAPLPGGKRVMALHTDPDLPGREVIKDARGFISAAKANKEMAEIVSAVDGPVQYCGVVAANSTRLSQVAGTQWAAAGDAAMSFDPLSSQGMFHAMAGSLQLAGLLLAGGQNPLDDPGRMEQIRSTYSVQMDNIWDRYLQHKNIFYAQEQRWKDAAFWQRRR